MPIDRKIYEEKALIRDQYVYAKPYLHCTLFFPTNWHQVSKYKWILISEKVM